MKILGKVIKPGTSHKLSIDFAKLYTNTQIEVPVIIERALIDGPTLLITAGIHGDEVNGVEIVRQIITRGLNKTEYGTVICIPLVNVFGFLNSSRAFPDGRDLNRVFPGSKTGSLASRFAHNLLTEIVPHVDYALDFHTGGSQRFNITQLRINKDQNTLEIAKKMNIPFILFSAYRKDTFREACVNSNKTTFLFEGGKAMYLDKVVTSKGLIAAKSLLFHIGLNTSIKDVEEITPIVIIRNKWVRALKAGMYRSYAINGSKIKKGQTLGTISDPFGQFEVKIKAPCDGHIICVNHTPLVNQGDALFNIGIE